MPTPPAAAKKPSFKKRQIDQLDRAPPLLQPDGSVLDVAPYALSPVKCRVRVPNHRWAFLVALNDVRSTTGNHFPFARSAQKWILVLDLEIARGAELWARASQSWASSSNRGASMGSS